MELGVRPEKVARQARSRAYKAAESNLWRELTGEANKEPSPGAIMEKLNELTSTPFDQDKRQRVIGFLQSAINGQTTAMAHLDNGHNLNRGHLNRLNWYQSAITNLNANESVQVRH